MSGSLVAVWSLIGLVAGVGVAAIAARLPDPTQLSGTVVAAIAIVNAIASGDRRLDVGPVVAGAALLSARGDARVRVGDRSAGLPHPQPRRVPALGGSLLLLLVATWQLQTVDAWEYYRGGLVGGAIYFALLFLPHLIYPKGMGMGDVKLALVMGLYLGWRTVHARRVRARRRGAVHRVRARRRVRPRGRRRSARRRRVPLRAFARDRNVRHPPPRETGTPAVANRFRAAKGPPVRSGPMIRFLTAGESHGQALVVIVEGLPAGLP